MISLVGSRRVTARPQRRNREPRKSLLGSTVSSWAQSREPAQEVEGVMAAQL
jgi:hypothetical protein